MAKKEKEPEDEGEKPEGEGAEGAPKKKGLKKMLIIAVPALLLVLGGGGFHSHSDWVVVSIIAFVVMSVIIGWLPMHIGLKHLKDFEA